MGLCVALAIAGDRKTGVGAAHARGRGRRADVLHLLLHLLARRLDRARRGAGPLLRLHDHAAGQRRDADDRRRAGRARRSGGCATSRRCSATPRTMRCARCRAASCCAGRSWRCSSPPARSWWWRCFTRPCPGRAGRRSRRERSCSRSCWWSAVGGSGRYVQSHGGVPWVKDRLHALVSDADNSAGGNGAGRLFTLSTNGRVDALAGGRAAVAVPPRGRHRRRHVPVRPLPLPSARGRRQACAQSVVQRAQRARPGGSRPLRRRDGPVRRRGGGQSRSRAAAIRCTRCSSPCRRA